MNLSRRFPQEENRKSKPYRLLAKGAPTHGVFHFTTENQHITNKIAATGWKLSIHLWIICIYYTEIHILTTIQF
jgi:hypothetical protein